MTIHEIKHRSTGAVLWTGEAESLKEAVAKAVAGGADLGGAYLGGAYLGGARNVSASLADHKDPETPFVRKATGSRAERAARYREAHPDVPVVEHLDAKILRAIETEAIRFDMSRWHGDGEFGSALPEGATPALCGTTHCRAGSAIHLAGEAGYALERRLGDPAAAGRAIYLASTGRSANFLASDERALADIRRRAEEDPIPVEG